MVEPVASHALASLVERLSEAAGLEAPALELLDPARGPREFLAALDGAEHHVDALKFLAYLLPPREAVWWAWMCARRQAGEDASPEVLQALRATEQWVSQPTDEHRRAAMAAGEAAGFDTPAGCAALAAFLSGGSLAPPELAEVPPPLFGTARAVFGSLVLSAVSEEPEKAPERYRAFYAHGTELANRIRLWDSLAPAS
jgi:hypothetical protein